MLDGPATVESVQPGGLQPVFNLDVAEDHDFFVGHRGALVHDNTLPELRLTPFDAEPDLTARSRVKRYRRRKPSGILPLAGVRSIQIWPPIRNGAPRSRRAQ